MNSEDRSVPEHRQRVAELTKQRDEKASPAPRLRDRSLPLVDTTAPTLPRT